jgi:hypothetical protein
VRELTRRDRHQAAGRLGELAEEARQIGAWLDASGDHAADKASVVIECAWRDLAAAAWLIRPADHSKPPGYLDGSRAGHGRQPAQDGQQR